MKKISKKILASLLVFVICFSSGSINILASNSSIDSEVSSATENQTTNKNVKVSNLEIIDSDNDDETLFGAVPTYNVGDIILFGRYPQNTTDTNVLEPLKWRVLSINGTKALLLTDKIVDFRHYHNTLENTTWATCDIRHWLNNSFYNKAFSTTEQSAIKKETLTPEGTQDNVFLLSKDEAETLFANNNSRIATLTTYTKNVEFDGMKEVTFDGKAGGWWLRTVSSSQPDEAYDVTELGLVQSGYFKVNDQDGYFGARPAIYIDLTSPYFTANESSVTYNLDGGDWIKDNTTWKELNKYKEGVVNILPTADEVKKDGYVLKGWSINGNDSVEISINTTWTGNLTVKALWTYEGDRALTDRENAAFIVRDEWTAWVKSFTSELSALDKNATSRIYSNMDFYDMQYRFTEKYKKVPEYLDEDGKPTDKLKNLIKEKRKEIAGGSKKIRDYLKFTSNQNGSTISFTTNGTLSVEIGYSKDGTTFTNWSAGENITLNAGEYIYVYNKDDTLSTTQDNYLNFNISGSIAASGNIMSLLDFADELQPLCFINLFINCAGLTSAPDLPALEVPERAYSNMFRNCTNLKEAPVLPAIGVANLSYAGMFDGCTNLEKGPYIKVTSIYSNRSLQGMFRNCTSLNYIKMDYTGEIDFLSWVQGVTATGTLYYNGPTTDHANNKIPTNFDVMSFTD